MCTRAAWVAPTAAWRATGCGWNQLHLLPNGAASSEQDGAGSCRELLADYPQVRFGFELVRPLVPRAVCSQYRESDFDFLRRILAAEGLNWRFEHDQADATAGALSQARHELVIFDSKAVAPGMAGDVALRFHGVRATETRDAIDQFGAVRRVRPNSVTSSSWDPQQLFAHAAEQVSNIDAGELPAGDARRGGERRHADGAAARIHSELVLQAFELDNKQFAGAGAVRQMAADTRSN
jgi:type VI secretion system secreted protein VgrG